MIRYSSEQDNAILPDRLRAVYSKAIVFSFHEINPFVTNLVRLRWLDIGFFLFARVCVSFHKHTEIKLDQYPSILTSRLVNNPDISDVDQF